jgi:hypothetical protein
MKGESTDSPGAPGPMPLFSSIAAIPARILRLLVVAPLWTAVAACGCHSSSESTRQTRAESIAPAKGGGDTSLLASGGSSGSGMVTKANGNTPSDSQSATSSPSGPSMTTRLTNFFTRKSAPESLALPRNDQDGENATIDGSPEKTAANEF